MSFLFNETSLRPLPANLVSANEVAEVKQYRRQHPTAEKNLESYETKSALEQHLSFDVESLFKSSLNFLLGDKFKTLANTKSLTSENLWKAYSSATPTVDSTQALKLLEAESILSADWEILLKSVAETMMAQIHIQFQELHEKLCASEALPAVDVPYWDFIFVNSDSEAIIAGIANFFSLYYPARKPVLVACKAKPVTKEPGNNWCRNTIEERFKSLNKNCVILSFTQDALKKSTLSAAQLAYESMKQDPWGYTTLRAGLNEFSRSLIID